MLIPEEKIRADFASALSKMFAEEVPEYKQFTDIVRRSNEEFLANNPHAEVDPEHRVLAEKHGAIRVGTAEEMCIVTRIFDVMGMYPVDFYDLTQLPKGALPMISTAFRPIDKTIEFSAFRMFCSCLHPEYITGEIKDEVLKELSNRRDNNPKFSVKLMELLKIAETKNGLNEKESREFINEVVNSFRIDKEKIIKFDLYKKLRENNDVFADIVCLGININHLTPRAYDIRDAHKRLEKAGIPVKDGGIEGPPIRDDAPIIQLNQTSRKAPGEELFVSNNAEILSLNDRAKLRKLKSEAPRIIMQDGEPVQDYLARIEERLKTVKLLIIQHKARFGEIESRGVALTEKGEEVYKNLLVEKKFKTDFPKTHKEMFEQGLAYYKVEKDQNGVEKLIPQTYEDFLAASAASIFKSNMSTGIRDGVDSTIKTKTTNNKELLEKFMGRKILSRHELYKRNNI